MPTLRYQNDDDWRFKGFRGSSTQSYDQKLAIPPRDPSQLAPLTAVSKASGGSGWNTTFGMNQPRSPSGTDWNRTFGQNNPSSPLTEPVSKFRPRPFIGDINGENRVAQSAGEELDLPNDRFRKLFGGGIPTPTPVPSPSPQPSPRAVVSNDWRFNPNVGLGSAYNQSPVPSKQDYELYGAGKDYGFTS
jgi:hypothetical protein